MLEHKVFPTTFDLLDVKLPLDNSVKRFWLSSPDYRTDFSIYLIINQFYNINFVYFMLQFYNFNQG